MQPFVALNWYHGGSGNRLRFNDQALQSGLPRQRYEVAAGAQLQLGRHWIGWGEMRVQQGPDGYRAVAGQLGLRAGW